MTKRFTFFAFLSIIIMLNENVVAKPQDVPEAAILAIAQVKDTFDNGAAASDKKEIEFFGAKVKNDMEIGFGDAIRSKRSNRLPISKLYSQIIQYSNMKRDKRSTDFSGIVRQIINSKEKLRAKREIDDNSIEMANSEEDYDYSSSYSSFESDDNERRKKSVD